MSLSLEQYVCEYLDTRGLPWPAMPKVEPVKAKPSLHKLPVKAVMWNVYGTLLAIPTGELQYEAQLEFVTDAALDKTIQEFKMWGSMSRKPGAPAAYMKELFKKAYDALRLAGAGKEKHPELLTERIWDNIVNKLMGNEYKFDGGMYGPLSEYVKKIAYFYHASIQGTGCYEGAAAALQAVSSAGIKQGLLADAQCFTVAQLTRNLKAQDPDADVSRLLPGSLRVLSCDHKAKKPSDTLWQASIKALATQGVSPSETLHVGSSLTRDIGPAKKLGFKTALFAGDKTSLQATAEQLKDPLYRPDAMITELAQVAELLP
jgi:FMN phosphatase YigB (HAD superfamily)